ncbi:MAG: MFS transporter [Nonomuraea sp.]|nr:MFS transporter [Nonomuraea sp.]
MQTLTARGDFRLLWAGQSLSLLGDQFMTLALPLLAVTLLGASPAQAALLPFALFVPFLPLGLPAGAIVDRLPRRTAMLVCDGVQVAAFGTILALAVTGTLTFPLLFCLVLVSGSAFVFFQVAYTSYLPALFRAEADLHRGNTRLALSESVAKAVGPMIAGPVIAVIGVAGAIAANALSFVAGIVAVAFIRHREPPQPTTARERGWLRRDIAAGLRFAIGHPLIEPVITCGTVYVLFLSMVETSLVLYGREVLHLSTLGIGVVVGAAALGFPVGNLLSARLARSIGVSRGLVVAASVSVSGIVLMPLFGSYGGPYAAVGLVAGSILHGIGDGAFGPSSATQRHTETPPELLGRVASVQRFLIWGAMALGSLLASLTTALAGLEGAVWVGGLGTVLCLPALYRRGIAKAARGAAGRGR